MHASCFCIKEEGLLPKIPESDTLWGWVVAFVAKVRIWGFLRSRVYCRTKIRAMGGGDNRKRSQSPLSQERELKKGGQTETGARDPGFPVPGRQVQEQRQT